MSNVYIFEREIGMDGRSATVAVFTVVASAIAWGSKHANSAEGDCAATHETYLIKYTANSGELDPEGETMFCMGELIRAEGEGE